MGSQGEGGRQGQQGEGEECRGRRCCQSPRFLWQENKGKHQGGGRTDAETTAQRLHDVRQQSPAASYGGTSRDESGRSVQDNWGALEKAGGRGKERYTDASKRALEKFKAEHPNLPKKKRKRKNEAQAKVKEEKEKEKEQEEQEEEET